MTLTPLDLFALIGIPSGSQPTEVLPSMRIFEEGVEAPLGWSFTTADVPHTVLIEGLRVESHRIATGQVQLTRPEIRQFARAMIMMLIQDCFVARGGDNVGLYWLVLLRDFSIIYT